MFIIMGNGKRSILGLKKFVWLQNWMGLRFWFQGPKQNILAVGCQHPQHFVVGRIMAPRCPPSNPWNL